MWALHRNTLLALALAGTGLGGTGVPPVGDTGKMPVPPRTAEARQPPAFHAGLRAACEAGEADGAMVLAVFVSGSCAACRRLQGETLRSEAFTTRGGPLHVAELGIEAEAATAAAFKVRSVPDLVLLASEGRIVARRQGFLPPEALLGWLDAGRQRAARGEWEGVASSRPGGTGILPVAGQPLADPQAERLVELLGEREPAARAQALQNLLAQGERAVPFLIKGVSHPHLGVRIGAHEALLRLAPASPPFDPWAPPAERQKLAAALGDWWARTGKLAPATGGTPVPPTPQAERAADRALQGVLSADPLTLTESMTALVGAGPTALPQVRAAIKRCERAGDRKGLWALEEVRWAILIPDGVEAAARGARRDLARGTSQERQAAALRLGEAGEGALPALAELVADGESLVQEGAARALSAIGGPQSLEALAALLRAADNNVRMVAAQALGQTKDPSAAKHLAAVLGDPDEMVACTAIAALEEAKATDRRGDLLRCLADPRWRVRAAAAEAIGKLKLRDTDAPLRALLDDPDPFVAKNALEALTHARVTLEPERLEALAKRLPVLTGQVAGILASQASPEAAKIIARFFEQGNDGTKAAILEAGASDMAILTKAAASPNPQLRRLAAAALRGRNDAPAAELITRLLDDNARDVRREATRVVLGLAAHRWGVTWGSSRPDHGILDELGGKRSTSQRPPSSQAGDEPTKDRQARAKELLAQHAAWRAILLKREGSAPEPVAAIAIYALGDGVADLPLLEKTFEAPDLRTSLDRLEERESISLILRRLPWPAGKAALAKGCRSPFFHAAALSNLEFASDQVRGFLLDPDLVLASLAGADEKTTESLMSYLLSSRRESYLSLLQRTEGADKLLAALLAAQKPLLHYLGIYALGMRGGEKSLATIEGLVNDKDPWIRRFAIQGIAIQLADPAELEKRLAPSLNDPEEAVLEVAVLGLLLPEVRAAASLDSDLRKFKFQKIQVYEYSWHRPDERPLVALPDKPPFLGRVHQLMESRKKEDDSLLSALVLLLAQYGDFSGIDLLASRGLSRLALSDAMAVGIALSKDPKYLPLLYSRLPKETEEWKLRGLLKAVRGMGGEEAREFRRAVNQRVREVSQRP